MPWKNGDDDNPRDPQQNRENNNEPPDLEEILRKWVSRLQAWTRTTSTPGNPSNNNPFNSGNDAKFTGAGIIALGVLVIWFLSGIFIVAPAEQAVILRFGHYHDTLGSGPHWIPRFIDKKFVINVENVDNFTYGGGGNPIYMLTKDENIVSVSVSVQYRVANLRDYLFNVVNPNMSLRQATASALRQVLGQSTLDQVLTTGRALIRQQVSQKLNEILSLYKTGIQVMDVAMQPAAAPEEVKDKFDEAIRAQEDEQRIINQAEAYARSVLPIADGRASRLLQEANAYKQNVVLQAEGDTARFLALLPQYQAAPNVTKERLYLDTIESVLSKTSKVIVDSTGNQHPLIYLPIDRSAANHEVMRKPTMSASEATTAKGNQTAPIEETFGTQQNTETTVTNNNTATNNNLSDNARDSSSRFERLDRDTFKGRNE